MVKLVLVRHGESVWNLENRFTGWTDVDLSSNGVEEAHKAGRLLKNNNYTFDIAYTSVLKRSIDTLDIILSELNLDIDKIYDWHLNERHYGALQGLNKDEMRLKYGEPQVKIWRRSYLTRPPALKESDPRYIEQKEFYNDINSPKTESLEDTMKRVVSFYEEKIKPELMHYKKVIIVAHGNSLRGLIKYLDKISDDDIAHLEIPTGIPLIYELDNNLNPIKHYYL